MTLRPDTATTWSVAVIDGPNMPNLGRRDEALHGPIGSLDELQAQVRDFAELLGITVVQFASNHEGEILESIHPTAGEVQGYVINPAGLTTYGEATRHALEDSGKPYAEVHFANLARHLQAVAPGRDLQSRFTLSAVGVGMGFRQYSHLGALLALALALDDESFLRGDDLRRP